MPPDLAEEIDIFETQIELRSSGKIEEKLFAETRLRRGVYGQRYDNGQRHDGVDDASGSSSRRASSPRAPRRCGTRPGMQRIKIPFGGVTPGPARRAGRAGRGVLGRHPARHHPPGLPAALRPHRRHARPACAGWPRSASPRARRAATRVRNVTACPLRRASAAPRRSTSRPTPTRSSASCSATPTRRTSGASSRSRSRAARGEACGLVNMHDLGAIARTRGAWTARAARLRALRRRRPRAPCRTRPSCSRRVPARGGAAADRAGDRAASSPASARRRTATARASSSWSTKLGHRGVPAPGARGARRSCATTRAGPRTWPRSSASTRSPAREPCAPLNGAAAAEGFAQWLAHQRRTASASPATSWPPSRCRSATSPPTRRARWPTSPAGTSATRCARPSSRTSCSAGSREADLPALYAGAASPIGLGRARRRHHRRHHRLPGHRHLQARHRVVARPGRRAAHAACAATAFELDEAVRGPAHQDQRLLQLLRPAPRGRHRLLRRQPQDRRLHGAALPGGARRPVARERRLLRPAPSARCRRSASPRWSSASPRASSPSGATARASRTSSPASARRSSARWSTSSSRSRAATEDPSFYTDWGDPREYTIGDMGVGECAGEVVSQHRPGAARAESIAFEAQVALEDGDLARADERAYAAMLAGARALVRTECAERRRATPTRSCASSGALLRHGAVLRPLRQGPVRAPAVRPPRRARPSAHEPEATRVLVEEAQLFIDAVHAFEIREAGAQSALV